MSYAIGNRIKMLRKGRDISQEEMAALLDTTRQRYSRIESGQIDISYLMIKQIADFLGVTTKEITSAEQEERELVTFFREKETAEDVVSHVAKIEEILNVFRAHEKLYYQTKERNPYVD